MSCLNYRTERLRLLMAKNGYDAFFIRDTSNIRWLSALVGVFDDEPAHSMLVTAERIVIYTDTRYANAFSSAAKDSFLEIDYQPGSATTRIGDVLRELGDSEVDAPFQKVGEGDFTLAVENSISLAEYRKLEETCAKMPFPVQIEETNETVIELRAVKDALEIQKIRAAQAITDKAFAFIVDIIRPGRTEREIQIELESFMVRHGAEGLAFPSIVATGSNAANPHAIPGSTVLECGQAVVLDFGARAQGYCSDMTRTVFLGRPDKKTEDAYKAICMANEAVEALLRPGVTGVEAQQLAEEILEEAGYGGAMGHSLGHGVGIDVHEEPVLASRNKAPLEEGNVVTVEPGIYISGEFGMRLEDFGVVTSSGFDVFTQSPHDPVII